jgi:hypothetical protein
MLFSCHDTQLEKGRNKDKNFETCWDKLFSKPERQIESFLPSLTPPPPPGMAEREKEPFLHV